ncbi:MAG: hypothetical protein HFJ50_06875 [Clostridia bacterium]|jgi:hypothetical protein|nr:hypothetical protein [Clostridia bacterium]
MIGTHSAGGIIGSMHQNSTVYSCYNYGKIRTTTSGSINQNYLAGGICGYMSSGGKNNVITISNCYNTGDIYGYSATGGITALNESAGKYYLNNNYNVRNINRKS